MELIAVCTIAIVAVALCCITVITAIFLKDYRAEQIERTRQTEQAKQIEDLQSNIVTLQSQLELLHKDKSNHFPYKTLEEIENFLAAAMKAEMLSAELEQDAEAFQLRAQTARRQIDRAYQIAHNLRGGNGYKNKNGS